MRQSRRCTCRAVRSGKMELEVHFAAEIFAYSGSAALGIVAAAHHSQRGQRSLRIFNWPVAPACAGSEARVAAVLVVSKPVEAGARAGICLDGWVHPRSNQEE